MLHGSLVAHGYLFLAITILFSIFLLYVYFCVHKKDIYQNDTLAKVFLRIGIDPEDISHDDSTWFFRGNPTCVGYGNTKCTHSENYCAGGDTYGTDEQQALAVKEAVINGGEHPQCPLIYPGAP